MGKRKSSGIRGVLVERCSLVIFCIEMKLQFSFPKYISICTFYAELIQLISAFLYDLRWTHVGSNSWEKPTASKAKMEQWLWSVNFLPIGKPKAADNMTSLFWGWHLRVVLLHAKPQIGNDSRKIYNVAIY